MAGAAFWDDHARARDIIQEVKRLKEWVEPFDRLSGKVRALLEMEELLELEPDEGMEAEIEREIESLDAEVPSFELRSLLQGPDDHRDAMVEISAGAGGTEAQDWASMLMRMYMRWAERRGFKIELIDSQPGEEAGIKSATFRVEGEYAYGLLSSEVGVHRLVRQSPFNSGQSRETSFASVFVTPEIDEEIEIEILDKDLRVDTYRSTGAGGQHINTTDSAVRITHAPTGIVVTCQNQRSQHQNREVAMKVLKSRLYELELAKKRAETDRLAESKRDISFGSQIRNYVLHPYRLVKDVRTKHETSDVDAVLDGELDDFIKEFLLSKRGVAAYGNP
jgi:peptide chain release factor 2